MGPRARARQDRRWPFLVFGLDDGRVLPSVLPLANGQSQERPTSRHLRAPRRPASGRAGAAIRTAVARMRERRSGRQGLSPDRGRARRNRRWSDLADAVGLKPRLFPPHIQGCHRPNAQGATPRRIGPRRSVRGWSGNIRHRGDVRRRLQFERAVLRQVDRHARHDADAVSRRRGQRRDHVRGWAEARSAPFWWHRARRGWPRFCSAMIPTSWCAIFRIASPRRV